MVEPTAWIRLTDRINAVIWHVPLPRRVQVRLSEWAYHNPPIPLERVRETLVALHAAGVDAWSMGGWGVDALLGRQSRRHRDLDVIIDRPAVAVALAALGRLGYREWYRLTAPAGSWYRLHPLPGRDDEEQIVLRDDAYRVVDLHVLDVPRSGLTATTGAIDGRPVRCLSARSQDQVYAAYRAVHRREHPNGALLRRAREQGRLIAPSGAR